MQFDWTLNSYTKTRVASENMILYMHGAVKPQTLNIYYILRHILPRYSPELYIFYIFSL